MSHVVVISSFDTQIIEGISQEFLLEKNTRSLLLLILAISPSK